MAQYWKSPHSSCLDSQQWQGRLCGHSSALPMEEGVLMWNHCGGF